jgi:hypothetical protein
MPLYLQCRNETSLMVSASSPTAAAKVSTPIGPPSNLSMIAQDEPRHPERNRFVKNYSARDSPSFPWHGCWQGLF